MASIWLVSRRCSSRYGLHKGIDREMELKLPTSVSGPSMPLFCLIWLPFTQYQNLCPLNASSCLTLSHINHLTSKETISKTLGNWSWAAMLSQITRCQQQMKPGPVSKALSTGDGPLTITSISSTPLSLALLLTRSVTEVAGNSNCVNTAADTRLIVQPINPLNPLKSQPRCTDATKTGHLWEFNKD